MTLHDLTQLGSDRARRRLAWGVPVLVALALGVAFVVGAASPSQASPNLPARSAAQLIAAVQTHADTPLSGQVHEAANLGVPSLPGGQSSASLSWQSFVTGTHNAKVWMDGADKQRVALLGQLSEAEVVHNGADIWTYTSSTNTVTHTTLKTHDGKTRADKSKPEKSGTDKYNPLAAANELLKSITPSTKVTVDSTRYVANRAAYTIMLQPKDPNSTVQKVTIAIDAKKFVPLQVQVFGASSTPAFTLGFSKVSFTTPSASTFVFHLPKGATISSNPLMSQRHNRHFAHKPLGRPAPTDAATHASPKVLGSGWTSVVELPAGGAGGMLGGGTLNDITQSGPNGSRLLRTALLNALITSDGRVFAGAVTPAYLEHVAATAH